MTEHARLSASSAHRWSNCLGSARMEAGLPDVDTEYSVEGTAAHEYAAGLLGAWDASGRPENLHVAYHLYWVRVRLKEGGHVDVPVTHEMREAVNLYFVTVADALRDAPPGARLLIEQRLTLDAWDPPEPMFGTGDAVIVCEDPAYVHVIDLKYGTGVVVEVQDNPQLLEYAGAAARMFMPEGTEIPDGWTAKTTIVQPRAPHPDGPVRTAEYTWPVLSNFMWWLLGRAREASDPNAPLTPGRWCRWCKAAGFCPALYEATQRAAQADFGTEATTTPAFPGVTREAEMSSQGALNSTAVATAPDGPYALPLRHGPDGALVRVRRMSGEAGGDKPAPCQDNSAGRSLAPRDPTPDATFEVLPPDPDRLPLAVAAAVLGKAAIVEAFLAGVRDRVRREIAAGGEVPGWKLVAGRPVREWADEDGLRRWAVDHGISEWELLDRSLRSPAQIEKLAKTRGIETPPEELWRKVSRSEKLVPADDPRPALPTNAQREFAALPPATDPTHEGGKPSEDM